MGRGQAPGKRSNRACLLSLYLPDTRKGETVTCVCWHAVPAVTRHSEPDSSVYGIPAPIALGCITGP
jgi:hypothetical protein